MKDKTDRLKTLSVTLCQINQSYENKEYIAFENDLFFMVADALEDQIELVDK